MGVLSGNKTVLSDRVTYVASYISHLCMACSNNVSRYGTDCLYREIICLHIVTNKTVHSPLTKFIVIDADVFNHP